jgi:hypothetical protein
MELPTRPYFCATCTDTVVSTGFPAGWYVITRSQGPDLPKIKLGLYCSLDCLRERMPVLQRMADAFDQPQETRT